MIFPIRGCEIKNPAFLKDRITNITDNQAIGRIYADYELAKQLEFIETSHSEMLA